jgi:hypothetical protein
MPPAQEINLGFVGIGRLLREGSLEVPRFQRTYAWEQSQVSELLTDVADAIAKQAPEYFLGTVVLTNPDGGTPQVIDGQQRLATTLVLLCAIRNHLLAAGDTDRAGDIERDFIAMRDLRTQARVPRLTLGVTDHTFFDQTVLSRPPVAEIAPTRESQTKLSDAKRLATQYVANVATTAGPHAIARLLDWVEYLAEKARVIVLRVPDATNAYRVFETLNDRGLELSVADLVKNYLLSLAGPRIEEVHAQWLAMAAVLEPLDEDDVLISFIRHFWSSRNGLTRAKQLFEEIKRKADSQATVTTLVSELARIATIYAALVEATPERWGHLGATTQGHIGTLNLLRMTLLRPLLLSVLDKMAQNEKKAAIKYIANAAVRIAVVGSRSGSLEEAYAVAAAKVWRTDITTARQLARELDAVVPQDREFEDAFAIATVSRDALGRYYLRALERTEGGTENPEWVPNPNQEEVTLEHVLPERHGTGWGHIDPEAAKSMWKRIGNMALLRAPANTAIGNRPFAEKRATIAESEFELTKEIAESDRWTVAAIETRQRTLAQLAVRTWPRTA